MTRATPQVGEYGYERVENDAYFTPPSAFNPFLARWLPKAPKGAFWECAAGDGRIAAAIADAGHDAYASDTSPAGEGVTACDFLKATRLPRDVRTIITNPPYSHGEEFVRHAIELTKPVSGAVAMLMRHEFDAAGTRYDLFHKWPFKAKYTLNERPKWFADKGNSPRHWFAWFVWDWNFTSLALSLYIPSSKKDTENVA
jgi:hypothetical protein